MTQERLESAKAALAVNGGTPIRRQRMPPRLAFGGDEFRNAVVEAFDYYNARGLDPGFQGHYEQEYCRAFVAALGAPGFADAVSTGTAALYVTFAALQLPAGSHVVVSPITDSGTLNAIVLNGLVPVLADSMPQSYNMGPDELEARLSDKVRAVCVVHAAGVAAPVDRMIERCRSRGIIVVEDCSQSHGARISGRPIGVFGDIAAFSTMYRKAHATSGCGGVVYTKDEALFRLVRAYSDRGKAFESEGFDDKDPTKFLFPALNLNIDEISCAIGLRSLAHLEDTVQRRLAFVERLEAAIARRSRTCKGAPVGKGDSPFFYPVFVDRARIACTKQEFAEAVRAEGIDLNPHYMYVACEWPYLRRYRPDDYVCANAIECRDASFNILLNENYGDAEVEDIASAIVKVEEVFIR